MGKKVIAFSNKPAHLPINFTLVIWLLLDRFQPAQWVVGAAITFLAVVWISSIVAICTQKQIDIFEEKK